jgi:NAD(P)-dependent dehydrogenase (short-subunit alcohol dehydrogenase family)
VQYPLGTAEDLAETVSLVQQAGGAGIALRADVRRPEDVAAVIAAAVAEFGRIDILVANAGIVTTARLWELSDEAWREMSDTNLTGVFHSLRAVVPHMRARRYGRIVVISRSAAVLGCPASPITLPPSGA